VLFLRLSKSGVPLFLVIVPDRLSCCIFRGRVIILLSLFFFLKMMLYYTPVVEFLFRLIRLTLNPLGLRYYLGSVEIFYLIFYFFLVIALEINRR
jgi:hypothetical protein